MNDSERMMHSSAAKKRRLGQMGARCVRLALCRAGGERSWVFLTALAVLLLTGFATAGVQAQTAHLLGTTATLGSGFNQPSAVAVDGAGNVYVADTYNNVIKKVPYSGGSYGTPVILGSGFIRPGGVAVDSAGNVYVADTYNNAIKKVPYSRGDYGTPVTLGSGFSDPGGVAVDSAGNVYVADTNNHTVKEIPYSGGAYGTPVIVASVTGADAIALDGSGNIFVVDAGRSTVSEIPYSGGSYGTPVTLGSGFDSPRGVVVDGANNVYVADFGNGAVEQVPYSGGSYGTPVTLGSGFSGPGGVAVDSAGNVYVANISNSAVNKIELSVDFGAVNIGASASSQTIAFSIDSAGPLGVAAVLTQGATGQDFTDAGTGTCPANVNAGDTCTVVVNFSPKSPGTRTGAVQLVSSSGTVLAMAYLQGMGNGAQVTFSAVPVPVTLGSGFYEPAGVAVDATGNVYVSDSANGLVKKVPYSGGSYGTPVTLADGFNSSASVAVDGVGNVYIADTGHNAIKKIPYNGDSYGTVVTLGTGFNLPYGVAVDGAGNVYVADWRSNAVKKIPYNGGNYGTVVTLASGFGQPYSVAVDGAGNLYIADVGDNSIKMLPYSGGSYGTPVTLAGGFGSPQSVAVDSAGDLYVADWRNSAIKMVPHISSNPSSYGAVVTLASGFSHPTGVAVDGAGNVYVADYFNNAVKKIDLADPPSLTFADTAVGSTSASQTVTVANTGNQPLTLPIPGSGSNPSLSAGFSLSNSSTCPQLTSSSFTEGTLAAGLSCTEVMAFAPESAASFTGALVLTDNAGNPSSTTMQRITLTGNGTQATATVGVTGASIPYGSTPTALSASIAYAGTTGPTGAVTFQVDGGAVVTASCTGTTSPVSCTASYVTGSLSVGGHTITVAEAADSNYTTASNTGTLTVTQGTAAITFIVPNHTYGDAPFAVAASSSSTGAFTYTVNSGPATISGNTVTLTGAGTVVLQANQAADTNYAANSTTASFNVVVLATGSIGIANLGTNQITLQLTSSATGKGYFTLLAGASATCGTAAQTVAGQDSTGTAAFRIGSLPLTASVAGNYTVKNLMASTAYTVCFTPDGSAAPVTGNVTTTAATALTAAAWAGVGSAGFSAGVAGYTSLSFSPDGTPYVTYQDNGNGGKATVMQYNGTSWVLVGSAGFSAGLAGYTSLSFSPDGTPYVADQDNGNSGKATVMKYDGTSWVLVGNAEFSADQAAYESLSFSPGGTPYVAYLDNGNSGKATVMKLIGVPAATTGTATSITGTGAILNGTVNDDGLATTIAFEYGTTASYGTTVAATTPTGGNLAAGSGSTASSVALTGLTPGTTYHFRIDVTGNGITVNGSDATFTTTPLPTVTGILPTSGPVTGETPVIITGTNFTGTTNVSFGPTAATYTVNSDTQITATSPAGVPGGLDVIVTTSGGSSAPSAADRFTYEKWTPTVTAGSPSVIYGTSSATLTASVAYTGPTAPTGGVTFTVNGSSTGVGAVTCTGTASPLSCSASYNTASLAANNYPIVATEAADSNYIAASNATSASLMITQGTAAITFNIANHTYGDAPFAVSASSSSTGAFTYTVVFGPATISGNMVTLTGTGTVVLKASQAADSNYLASSQNASFTVGAGTAAITFSVANHTYGDAPFAVSASSSSTGAFTYTVVSGPATIAGNIVTLTGAGTVVLKASQAADSNYTVNSQNASFTVGAGTAAITFSVANHTYGDAPFAVSASSSSTGAFTYTVVSGPALISGNTVTLTGTGTVVLKVSQAADSNYAASSQNATFTVAASLLTLTANNATRYYGATNPAFTGTVSGQKNGDMFAESFSTSAVATSAPGTYSIVPTVSGTNLTDYTVTTNNGVLTITQAPTTTGLVISATQITPVQPVTLTITVASTTSGVPAGTVAITDNGAPLTTVPLSNGTATYTTLLAPGVTHALVGTYSGDTGYLGSASNASATVITVAPLQFSFTNTETGTFTAAPGTTANYSFNISPNYSSYPAAVTFSVTGLPSGATASFSPATFPANAGTQTVTLSVKLPQAVGLNQTAPRSGGHTKAFFALLLLPLIGSRTLRRKLRGRVLMALLLCAGITGATALTGCGSDSGFLLQQPSSYALTITATSGPISQSQVVTLIVQ